MPDQLKLTTQDLISHTFLKVEGNYCLDAFLDMILYVDQLGMNSESKKVICDIRSVEDFTPNDTERFRMGTAIAETVNSKVYLAGVAAPESINHFAELVANNRGANFKMFSCQDAARQWLLEEDVVFPKGRLA